MSKKANKKNGKTGKNGNVTGQAALEGEELEKKKAGIKEGLVAQDWMSTEVGKQFKKDEKLDLITDATLIIGGDIGRTTHYVRAINARGKELSIAPYSFNNTLEDYEGVLDWATGIAAKHGMNQIIFGLEPTAHYWEPLCFWLQSKGVTVVIVNPKAVKATKEIEDNSQVKSDRKDPKVIANLVKDGNYGMPYLPEGGYAPLREYFNQRDQTVEMATQAKNRLHRELFLLFPEYATAFGTVDGAFTRSLLKVAPTPAEIVQLGVGGIKDVWKENKLRGAGYRNAVRIYETARRTVGIKADIEAHRHGVLRQISIIESCEDELRMIEGKIKEILATMPSAANIMEIPGIGATIAGGILAQIGDISRFCSAKEIQKLAGLSPVSLSSGQHQGQTRISRRGRKRLRYWLWQAALSAVAHSPEFKQLFQYYLTREKNPLKKMPALVCVSCKILRIIFAMIKRGTHYDPRRVLGDIKRPDQDTDAA